MDSVFGREIKGHHYDLLLPYSIGFGEGLVYDNNRQTFIKSDQFRDIAERIKELMNV